MLQIDINRTFSQILVALVGVALSCLFCPSSSIAQKTYDTAQLKYIFSGAEWFTDHGACGSASYNSPPSITLKFERDQKLGVSVNCQSRFNPFQLEKKGYWKVEDNKICLELSLTADSLGILETSFDRPGCWPISRWNFGFVALDNQAEEAWHITLISHPKNSSKEEIWAALEKISRETELAEKEKTELAEKEARRKAEAEEKERLERERVQRQIDEARKREPTEQERKQAAVRKAAAEKKRYAG